MKGVHTSEIGRASRQLAYYILNIIEMADIESVMTDLKKLVYCQRIRLKDFLTPYDNLKSGSYVVN